MRRVVVNLKMVYCNDLTDNAMDSGLTDSQQQTRSIKGQQAEMFVISFFNETLIYFYEKVFF